MLLGFVFLAFGVANTRFAAIHPVWHYLPWGLGFILDDTRVGFWRPRVFFNSVLMQLFNQFMSFE
jgi:hypothetical protein